jgi:hypothetical protein
VNSAIPRLVALLALLTLLGIAAFFGVRHVADFAPGQDGLALGMAWLKREYQLDDATFEKVTAAHSSYFRECEQRCHELEDVNRHFLSQLRETGPKTSDLDAVQVLQESICHGCRIAMIDHVHQVSALMPPESGRRFISDVQSVLSPSSTGKNRAHR